MKNLRLYITPEQYKLWAGGDWPTYDEFMEGKRPIGTNDLVDEFINSHTKAGIQFPIRTKTSCQSKWNWSTIYLNMKASASCHRVNPVPFTLEEFDNFHNLPKKIDDRRLMLSGQWPTGGCEYCKNIEDAGGHSDRQHNLQIPDLTPPELINDPTALYVTPTIIEIFAQNTCNFSCVYCNAFLSSQIEQENKKFGKFDKNGVRIPVIENKNNGTDEYFNKFTNWLYNNIQSLKRLHLLGGETFIQHDLMTTVLDIISKRPNKDLEFCIFSNMNAPEKYWDLYINQIKDLQKQGNLKRFDLTASIDCWGPEAEYVRSGLDLDLFEKRLAWAAEQDDWMHLNVNQTVTSMTMHSMPDLIDKVRLYSKNKHIGHYFQFYTGAHMFQHPQVFSYDLWSPVFDRTYAAMPTATAEHREAILRMQGLQKQLQVVKKNNFSEINKLHIYLDELDRRRGTNWRVLFPYLIVNE